MTPDNTISAQARPAHAHLWITLAVCAAVTIVAFGVPIYVIRPFRAQGATELAIALVVRRWGPGLAAAAMLPCLAAAFLLWRRASGWRIRAGVAALCLLALGFAVLSQVNVFELMFHPAGVPQFVPAGDATIEQDDMLLTVNLGGQAHAYPIREMGYHHIVNDWVGGTPIAATY